MQNPRSRSLTLGLKLGSGFALLTLLTLCLGLFSLNRLSVLNRLGMTMSDNYINSANRSATLAIAIQDARRLEARLLLAETASDRAAYGADLAASFATVEKARNFYDPLIDPGKERSAHNTAEWRRPPAPEDTFPRPRALQSVSS